MPLTCFRSLTYRSAVLICVLAILCGVVLPAQASTSVVTHAMGQTRVVSGVNRVITLFQGATDSAVALGIRPVGVVDSWAETPTYDYLREALQGVQHLGLETQPNLEKIVALKPDLIIGARSRHEKIYPQLQQIAPTVLTDNVYDFQRTLALTGVATGREAMAQALWQQWQHNVTVFRQQLASRYSDWPLTASVLDIRADHLRLYLRDSFAGQVLSSIGFRLPAVPNASWGIKIKSKETLPSADADVFFVIKDSDQPAVVHNYDAWRTHPIWKVLKAPRMNQVYEVNKVSWLLSGGILGANLMLDQLSTIYPPLLTPSTQ
ncbi:iron-siderophore ABC transporter substrate-binding protein [Vibrio sp. ABG19]|uniref:ABC transporter substrate-binding protein n=1 Tax=Vibrio sp. ABG19 TaxID=2817385 RepID=UPI00249E0D63|nr:iron-siderophore ABC transporter substrate-binding protein [Vibrio sp. ABG19]WGY45807.1 iron-siderophore ABC transporter substrate-binding protein [Vibrio sp. ABG19]